MARHLVDLINGETLCDKLKELKLGADTKLTEIVDIKKIGLMVCN